MSKFTLWPWAANMFAQARQVIAEADANDLMITDGIALTYVQALDLVTVYHRAGHRIIYSTGGDVLVHSLESWERGFTIHLSTDDKSFVFAWDYKGFSK
ncbi:hypothetical protein D3C86_1321410 [compost metagenome]